MSSKIKRLNIGCGKDIKSGFVNLDQISFKGVDVVHNISSIPWPFDNNVFDEVVCSNILEHIPNLIEVMDEL